MPTTKKRAKLETEEEDSAFEEEDRDSSLKPGTAFVEKDGTRGWELGKKRRLTVSEFKGKVYVGIREYYEKDGKLLPGKRGLNLTPEQFRLLVSLNADIEKLLREKEE